MHQARDLRVRIQGQHPLAGVVRATHLEPLWLPIAADRLCRLQEVLDLGEVRLQVPSGRCTAEAQERETHVGVRVVPQRVELLHRFPDT